MRQLRIVLGLLLSLLAVQTLGKKDKPDIDKFNFHARPAFILYFEDSDVVLATNNDEHATYRSDDAGANWAKCWTSSAKSPRSPTSTPPPT